MSTTDAVPVEITSTGEPLAEVDGAMAESETVLTEFSTKTWRDDLTLVVENRQLYVSKSVLSFASPVFDAMFTAEFQEKDKEEIILSGKTLDDFVEFLKCIYPGIMKPVTLENVFKILPLANEYQIESLKSACEVCLLSHLSNSRDENDVYVVLEQACTYRLEPLKEKCIATVAERPHEFDDAASTFSFSVDVQNEIRKRLMQALSIKNKDLYGRVKTSEALNRFLGDMASRRELVTQYLGGRVDGDYVHLKVSSRYNNNAKMCIGGSSFSISLSNPYNKSVRVEVECEPQHTINCLIAVLVHNWMLGDSDKTQVSKLTFANKKATCTFWCDDFATTLLENEKAGFMYRGTMDFYIYLFCIEG